MELFNAEDVLEFAIRIEENGEKFYRDAERAAKDAGAKQLFKRLADDENKHKDVFETLLTRVDRHLGDLEDYEGEFLAHLRSHIDGRAVFLAGVSAEGDPRAVLDAAMQREIDSVVYYQGLKSLVSKSDVKVLERIIDEEQRHFAELSRIKREGK